VAQWQPMLREVILRQRVGRIGSTVGVGPAIPNMPGLTCAGFNCGLPPGLAPPIYGGGGSGAGTGAATQGGRPNPLDLACCEKCEPKPDNRHCYTCEEGQWVYDSDKCSRTPTFQCTDADVPPCKTGYTATADITTDLYVGDSQGNCHSSHPYHYTGTAVWAWAVYPTCQWNYDATNSSYSDNDPMPSSYTKFGALKCVPVGPGEKMSWEFTVSVLGVWGLFSRAYRMPPVGVIPCPYGTYTNTDPTGDPPTDCSHGSHTYAVFPDTIDVSES
jgi:hypothetical protein